MSAKEILNGLEKEYASDKPKLLTMYFEDGGEEKVVSFEDYNDLQQENSKYKERISKVIEIIRNDTTLNCQRQRDRLIQILESGD